MDFETELEYFFGRLLKVANANSTLFGLHLGSADATLHLSKGSKEKHVRYDRQTMVGALFLEQSLKLENLMMRGYELHKLVFRSRGKESIKKTYRYKDGQFIEYHTHDRKKAKK